MEDHKEGSVLEGGMWLVSFRSYITNVLLVFSWAIPMYY